MALHLIKLCVGATCVGDLTDWHRSEARRVPVGHDRPAPICDTRMSPKRVDEVLDGGSLYWVIKGLVLVRQPITDIVSVGQGALARCEIVLEPSYVLTVPTPRKAFQGWRYLDAREAPADLGQMDAAGLPEQLVAELRSIGAW